MIWIGKVGINHFCFVFGITEFKLILACFPNRHCVNIRHLSLETVVFGAVFPGIYSKSYHRGHFPKSWYSCDGNLPQKPPIFPFLPPLVIWFYLKNSLLSRNLDYKRLFTSTSFPQKHSPKKYYVEGQSRLSFFGANLLSSLLFLCVLSSPVFVSVLLLSLFSNLNILLNIFTNKMLPGAMHKTY